MYNKILLKRATGYLIDKLAIFIIVQFTYVLPYYHFFHHYHYHHFRIPSLFVNAFNSDIIRGTVIFMFGYPCIEDTVFLAIYIVLSAFFFDATYGMSECGLSIQDSITQKKPGVLKIFLWYVLAHISAIILGIGYLWAFIDSKGRTLHDIIAGVTVIYNENDKTVSRRCHRLHSYRMSKKAIHR